MVALSVPDVRAPTAPVLGTPTSVTTSSMTVPLTTAANDVGGSGLASGLRQRATNAGFTTGLVTDATGALPLSRASSGLVPSTTYFYRERYTDGAGNVGAFSATVSATTAAAADTTAPTVPVITASVVNSTTIRAALTTPSTDAGAGLASYRLEYKRTVDVTWTLVSAALTGASFPVDITGLTASTSYDTRCSATDAAVPPNTSAFSTTSTISTTASSTLAFPTTVADQTFAANVAGQTLNLNTLLSAGAPAAGWASDALPSGQSLNQSTGVISGTPIAAPANYDVLVTASDVSVADADWNHRSTRPGVFYANNFTYKDTAKTQLITNDADLIASAAQVAAAANLVKYNTVQKLSGNGSLKLAMTAGSTVDTGWNFDFGGIAISSKLVSKHQFYFQFSYYIDSVYYSLFPGAFEFYGGKIAIIECPNHSFDPGEIVIRRLPVPNGFVAGYVLDASNVIQYFGIWTLGNTDAALNNFIDKGSPVVTNTATAQQRYGVNYANKDDTVPNANYSSSSPRLVSNGWFTFEVMVDQVNNKIKVWGAPYGSAPTLIMGRMNAGLPAVGTLDKGTNAKQLYTGIQLTNYFNALVNPPASDTFVGYDELIVSDNPIRFPGGFDLPFPGTTTPTGYPPAGTSEQ